MGASLKTARFSIPAPLPQGSPLFQCSWAHLRSTKTEADGINLCEGRMRALLLFYLLSLALPTMPLQESELTTVNERGWENGNGLILQTKEAESKAWSKGRLVVVEKERRGQEDDVE